MSSVEGSSGLSQEKQSYLIHKKFCSAPGLESGAVITMQVRVSGEAATEFEEPNPPIVPVSYRAAAAGARQLILHRFPFSLITIEKGRTIIAVVDFPRSIGRMSSKLAYLEY